MPACSHPLPHYDALPYLHPSKASLLNARVVEEVKLSAQSIPVARAAEGPSPVDSACMYSYDCSQRVSASLCTFARRSFTT